MSDASGFSLAVGRLPETQAFYMVLPKRGAGRI